MEPKHDTALSPKGSCTATDTKRGNMYLYPALLCFYVVSMLTLCHGLPLPLPLPADTVKNFVKLQAENIRSRIQRHQDELHMFHNVILDTPELLPELPSDKPIEGLVSMVETLNIFQRVLHSLPKGHVSQLHTDVSTLQDYLEQRMTSLQCAHRKTAIEKSLEAYLKNNRTYYMTLGRVALDRLQKYLQKLIHNLDHLKSC